MAWTYSDYRYAFAIPEANPVVRSSAVNEQCFIRKSHKCGKMFAASKSCFIACPTEVELEPILSLMSEKLTKLGVEPIIAVKERAYGQDIFCTKICGKVIESRFCVVVLNDTIQGNVNVPNPNVYYEYGLMTALRKHIIPLQKNDLTLAFNIQSYDTVKYHSGNISSELDRAIRDAVAITETSKAERPVEALDDKALLRRMEMAGFEAKDEEWFLHRVIQDTAFRGFGSQNPACYVYAAKLDTPADFEVYLEDLGVVLYRTDKRAKGLEQDIQRLKSEIAAVSDEQEEAPQLFAHNRALPARLRENLSRRTASLQHDLGGAEKFLTLMSKIYLAFFVSTDLDCTEFEKNAAALIDGQERYSLTFSQDGKINFGEVTVDLSKNPH